MESGKSNQTDEAGETPALQSTLGHAGFNAIRRAVREFDASQAVTTTTAGDAALCLQKVMREDAKEAFLYCHSSRREAKETAMVERFGLAYEPGFLC